MPSAEVNNVWGQVSPVGHTETHTLPSGQIVVAKRVALQDLIVAGVVTESDGLSAYVQKHHLTSGRVKQDDAMAAAMEDPKMFGSLVLLLDRVVPHIVVEPVVRLHLVDLDKPAEDGSKTKMIPPDERDPGVIYTDQIPLQDKVFLLGWAVGDVNRALGFRQESQAAVAGMANVAGVPDSPKHPSRNRKGRPGKPPRIRD